MTPTDSPALRDALPGYVQNALAAIEPHHAETLRDFIASLTTPPAERADAEDAARLDWLDANGFTAYRAIDPIDGLSDHCVVVHETQRPRRGNVADTIRKAIDAARATQQPNDGGEG